MMKISILLLACLAVGSCADDTGAPVEPTQNPSLAPQQGLLNAQSNAGSFHLELETSPSPIPLNEHFTLRFRLMDGEGAALGDDLSQIALDADMPEHGHGMKVAPVLEQRDGWIHASPMLFHMPGLWEIYVDRTRGHVTERAQLSFRVF